MWNVWNWIMSAVDYFLGCKGTLIMLGLDDAGKTTLLSRLKDDRMTQPVPTWQPHSESLRCGNVTFTTYDIGGHKQVRRVWQTFFPVADGILYIIDGHERKRFAESKAELDRLLIDDELAEVPVVILINKIDIPGAAGHLEVAQYFNLGANLTGQDVSVDLMGRRPVALFPCSVLMRQGYGDALKWMAHYLKETRRRERDELYET